MLDYIITTSKNASVHRADAVISVESAYANITNDAFSIIFSGAKFYIIVMKKIKIYCIYIIFIISK